MRTLVPNVITLLALCAGLTAIRLAVEDRLEWALAAIVFAAMLDGIDGRVARMLKGTSRFGAELDSLADFVNFGVAPALILYFWGLHELKSAGWIAAMVFAICAALRLARFNVMIEDPNRPAWAGKLLRRACRRRPARSRCCCRSMCSSSGVPHLDFVAPVTFLYTLGIAFLMVSRLPVFSGKRVGKRVAPEMVLPVFVLIVLFFALLISYPWEVLTIGTVIYLATLPLGWLSYRSALRKTAAASAAAGVVNEAAGPTAAASRGRRGGRAAAFAAARRRASAPPSARPGSTEPRLAATAAADGRASARRDVSSPAAP